MNRFLDDTHPSLFTPSARPAVRRAKSYTNLQPCFVSHGTVATEYLGLSGVDTHSLCEFSQIQIPDFNLPVPTNEKQQPIRMPVPEFNKCIQRHITILQSQLGRQSPLIYYHPARPRVVSCVCYKIRSIARFRHEFIAIVFEYLGTRYRVQFDRGWQRPERAGSLQWLSGKPDKNYATISFESDPIMLEGMIVLGQIRYQTNRLPLLTRTSKHVTEVFDDAPE